MSEPATDTLRKFEQKMHEQGSDGFADGPRPWENWDESGNQANSRVWEGSASRVYSKGKKAHSLGHKFLTLLAFMAFATLLTGIGGVVYTHMQTPQLASDNVQPRTVAAGKHDDATTAVKQDTRLATASHIGTDNSLDTHEELNAVAVAVPAADEVEAEPTPAESAKTALQPEAESDEETDTTGNTTITTDDTDAAPETAPSPTTVTTNKAIESVSIETIVTEKSVTTTVYTRHPQQQQANIIAAIETTPPPFAHEIVSAQTDTADAAVEEPAKVVTPINDIIDEDIASTYNTSTATHVADVLVEDNSQDSLTLTSAATNEQTAEKNAPELSRATAEETPQAEPVIEQVATEPAIEVAPVSPAPAVKPKQAIMPVKNTGNWVINLSSYTWKSTAERKLAEFQSQGVDAEVFEVTIKDKPMYRIRVSGFDSSGAAKTEAKVIEQTLGLEGAWVSRR